MEIKILTKKIVSSLMCCCGIHSIAERLRFRKQAIILMYHRVFEFAEPKKFLYQAGMFVTEKSFEKQIGFLKNRFELVFLDELVQRIAKREDIGRLCAITFDDGWRDNYTVALPILKKHQAPATIFLTTNFVGTDKVFWPDEFCYCLDQALEGEIFSTNSNSTLKPLVDRIHEFRKCRRETLVEKAINVMKSFSPDEREKILEYFRSEIMRNRRLPAQIMSWEEAKEMQATGLVRFGAHSANHEILDQVSLSTARHEVTKSRDEIQKHLCRDVNLFAYPNGNFNSDIQQVVKDNGFIGAVTTRKGFVRRDTPLMEIPRIGIHEDISNSVPMLRSRILFDRF
jgi:peptidoglycan/xylan/chitin deacetylase (PgdA/CDA1 family)